MIKIYAPCNINKNITLSKIRIFKQKIKIEKEYYFNMIGKEINVCI